ncbi:MAG: hypothetical protein AAF616_07425 [Bacteroidota bacterium]
MNQKNIAKEVSYHFPEIEDRLVNLLELGEQGTRENDLVLAAIQRKALKLNTIQFSSAINYKAIKKYLVGLGAVVLCFLLVSSVTPEIIRESPKRIARYSESFERLSPFRIILMSKDLEGFKGERFTVAFKIEGEVLPEEVKVIKNGVSKPLTPSKKGLYSFDFENLQSDKSFKIDANGYLSQEYRLQVNERPELLTMMINIEDPAYTGGDRRAVTNAGEISVLEGSVVSWEVETSAAEKVTYFSSLGDSAFFRDSNPSFTFSRQFRESQQYEIRLTNQHSSNKSLISYNINVAKDQYPEIDAEFFPDSIFFQYLIIAGAVSDDYGFSRLNLNYRKVGTQDVKAVPISLNLENADQSFYYNWQLQSLELKEGEKVEVYVTVADNDGINGPKVSRSQTFILQIPTQDSIDELLSSKSDEVESGISEAQKASEEIAQQLQDLEDRLKTNQKLDWRENKMLEEIIKDREQLNSELNQLQKNNKELQQSTERFQKQSPELKQKNEQLQELIQQLLDPKTKELYEKLKKLLKENAPKDQISDQLEQLQRNEQNVERDMQRALELFKRLKMESVLEQSLQKLDSIGSKQEKAAKAENQAAEEVQNKINKDFEKFREQMDSVAQMNQELKKPEALQDFEYEEKQIAKDLRDIEQMMEDLKKEHEGKKDENAAGENEDTDTQKQQAEKQKNDLKQKQQGAGQKMKSLSQKLSKMQGGMQMEMMQLNLDQLRDILDNLIKLSFAQESNMQEMRQVNQSDPRFLSLSQNQLKLRDDAQVIQDSLLSLAQRVVQISSFVTREVDQINQSINDAIRHLKDRNRGRALTSQQFSMTSINNLALLLDDTMQQMQMAMAEAQGKGSPQNKPQGMPDLQELQNQLGKQINELKGSQKEGRELAEELARLAAEQEMIRQQFQQLKEAEEGRPGGEKAGDQLQKAIEMMEQNEVDLVNKRLTQQLLFRQQAIKTRLLEADKAKREQETEEEREANQPSNFERNMPPELEEYLNSRKKEIELLKTIPVELKPFYKKEVNDYFRRISSQNPE